MMQEQGGMVKAVPTLTTQKVVDPQFDRATIANSNSEDATVSSFQRIALTFSTQGLGFISVPLLAYPMLELGWNVDAIWRVLLGAGALPGFLVLFLRLRSGGSYSRVRRKAYDRAETVIDNQDAMLENITQDDGPDDKGLSTDSSVRKEKAGTSKFPSSNERDGNSGHATNGSSADGASPTFNGAVSSLFSSNLTNSGSNKGALHESNNEMALVEHSHLEYDQHDDEKRIENFENHAHNSAASINHSRGLWASILTEPNLGRKFAGTAGAWLLFDVTFYGNTLFEPLVLEAAFGSHSTNNASGGYELLQTTVRDSLVISLLSLPGYFVTVFVIGRPTCVCRSSSSSSTTRCGSASCLPCIQTPTYIQMQGFLVMSILYIIIGLFWTSLSNIQWLLLVLYAGTFFFANYGPNTTTFLLPSVTYSEDCRSTLNGISAAAGKLGALMGASLFAPAADMW
eukprot:CAMPEP_0181080080 /NCGR_PEP_ID=MMETSP1071-20121207/2377_1 /TAXON_ID=35127 /ORGANISM="Thalassiosira sp., Strain NH16" /LENGTH=455 /DNA_ID=CAMNT_0023161535 /DNA_START=101 /DNA_END=1465 /DNA_ORIENTATION=+